MKKRLLLGGLTAVLITATGLSGMALVSADSTHTVHAHKITRTDKRIRATAKLNQAVRDGTITSTQKTAFETEVKALKSEHAKDITKSSTKADRQAERAKLKSELQAWANSNNFPLAKIFPKLSS